MLWEIIRQVLLSITMLNSKFELLTVLFYTWQGKKKQKQKYTLYTTIGIILHLKSSTTENKKSYAYYTRNCSQEKYFQHYGKLWKDKQRGKKEHGTVGICRYVTDRTVVANNIIVTKTPMASVAYILLPNTLNTESLRQSGLCTSTRSSVSIKITWSMTQTGRRGQQIITCITI